MHLLSNNGRMTTEMTMSALFDNERFVVVYIGGDHKGVEIVDKAAEASLFLHGRMYDAFEAQLEAWKENVPCEEDVEACLQSYTALAMCPLVQH